MMPIAVLNVGGDFLIRSPDGKEAVGNVDNIPQLHALSSFLEGVRSSVDSGDSRFDSMIHDITNKIPYGKDCAILFSFAPANADNSNVQFKMEFISQLPAV